MHCSVAPEWESFIQSKIAAGIYASADDAVNDAIRHLTEADAWGELRTFLQPRIDAAIRGEAIAVEPQQLLAELRASDA